MKKLLAEYSFTTKEEYFYMVRDSFMNGQFKQAHEQIKALPKESKKDLLRFLIVEETQEFTKEQKIWLTKHTIELI